MIRAGWIFVLALSVPAGFAYSAVPMTDDAAIEKRLHTISEELRCLVCQNESLAGSRADLAVDLRREIRTRIAGGESDQAIRNFLVERYGDFILYRPPWKLSTILLWLGPALLLFTGMALLARQLRRRRVEANTSTPADAELSPEEHTRLARLLAGDETTAPPGQAPRT